ncbi:MAG: SRPBCC family protein [Chloroflexi bacterium]|nr:SRPBCC family protein [Chloroflexota bacterium]
MRWLEASASRVVRQAPDQVFAFSAAIENMPCWVIGVSEPRRVSGGEFGAQSTFVSKYTYGGRTHDIRYEVTAFDAPRCFAIRSIGGPFPFQRTVTIEPAKIGSRIENRMKAGSDSRATSVSFLLGAPLLRRLMQRRLRQELDRLRQALPEGPAPPPPHCAGPC